MLTYLDTLIGFVVVMLGASLLITIGTQMISALLSHRGANLLWGLETMFRYLPDCPCLNDARLAAQVARDILTHPLISDSIFSLKPCWLADRLRLASAIHPDELVAILLDLSTKPAYQAIADLPAEIDALLKAQSVAADRRASLHRAVAEAGKLEAWFNCAMDRVSARFTTCIRLWTVALALTFALGTGLNAVTLLSDLYTNGSLRRDVVAGAAQMSDLAGHERNDAATLGAILQQPLFNTPEWNWKPNRPFLPQLPGVLVTAALLSLGAPFWFNMLKDLTGLRPILAGKLDGK